MKEATNGERVHLGELMASSRNAGGTFFCMACLEDRQPVESSPDPRYCQGCYDFLTGEDATRGDRREQRTWHPVREHRTVIAVTNLCIEVGDRVQIIGDRLEIDAKWMTVEELEYDSSSGVDGIVLSVTVGKTAYPITTIVEHQKGKEDRMKANPTPQENLTKCRETLAKVEAKNADPRVIGLWRSKVAQAERMCAEVADVTAGPATVPAVAGVLTEPAIHEATEAVAKPKLTGATTARPCQCGCGLIAHSGRNFLQGHDAKFASMIRKLDASKVKLEELPSLVQQLIADDSDLVKHARNHNK